MIKQMILSFAIPVILSAPAMALEVGAAAPCVVLDQIKPDGMTVNGCIRVHNETQKFTLIEFFSINCDACAQNLPGADMLAEEIKATTQTRFISIDRDVAAVRSYVSATPVIMKYPVALDNERDAKKAYGVSVTPTLFLLDNNNTILFKHEGVLGSSDISAIKQLTIGM